MGISKSAWIKPDPSDAEDFGKLLKIYIWGCLNGINSYHIKVSYVISLKGKARPLNKILSSTTLHLTVTHRNSISVRNSNFTFCVCFGINGYVTIEELVVFK